LVLGTISGSLDEMQAFKKVLNFAAKEQHVPDSQRDWKRWKAQQGKDEDSAAARKDSESSKSQLWVRLEDKDGKPYKFNEATGETSYDLTSDEEDETSDEELVQKLKDEPAEKQDEPNAASVRKAPPMLPQVWEKHIDSLTRKARWHCAEIGATLDQAPPEHPWRGVAMADGKVYIWNPETNETKWPS
jgi:hypothetical protein